MTQYQLQVKGPWVDDEWRPAVTGPFPDTRPRNFGTRRAAEQAMEVLRAAGGPFQFRVEPVDG